MWHLKIKDTAGIKIPSKQIISEMLYNMYIGDYNVVIPDYIMKMTSKERREAIKRLEAEAAKEKDRILKSMKKD